MKRLEFIKAIKVLPTLKEKQLFYLNEVTKRFNLNNLSITDNGVCVYKSINESGGCAVGFVLTENKSESLDAFGYSGVDSNDIFEELPIWLQNLSQEFLRELQQLHDDKDNWIEIGLSELGREKVEEIKLKYNL